MPRRAKESPKSEKKGLHEEREPRIEQSKRNQSLILRGRERQLCAMLIIKATRLPVLSRERPAFTHILGMHSGPQKIVIRGLKV